MPLNNRDLSIEQKISQCRKHNAPICTNWHIHVYVNMTTLCHSKNFCQNLSLSISPMFLLPVDSIIVILYSFYHGKSFKGFRTSLLMSSLELQKHYHVKSVLKTTLVVHWIENSNVRYQLSLAYEALQTDQSQCMKISKSITQSVLTQQHPHIPC